MAGIFFFNQLWFNTSPLDRKLVFDYFASLPLRFVLWQRTASILIPVRVYARASRKTTDTEYALGEVMEPHLFLIRKQKRNWQEKITLILAHYILSGSIYPAPLLASGFASRIEGRFIIYRKPQYCSLEIGEDWL
ncbi:hypothetical protein ZIOFF_076210 [Zingiber officinale]|uniref:Mediator of RNA polymerase II transcription subunit 6 n=1 Tax=Zingiber officinale TaxID=94328 RepID=A0A8J5ES68_ZINOF|nr:hypothetical protein ZIOFF_076210 [Zingiber officinale]